MSTTQGRRYTYRPHTLDNGQSTYAIVYIDERGQHRPKRFTTNLTEAQSFVRNINRTIRRVDREESMYYPTKQQLVEHIQTLNGLIDGCEDDELGSALAPIVAMLEKMVSPLIATEDQ